MKINVYSIYDRVCEAYAHPFYCADSPEHALAIRTFKSMVKPGSLLYDNPDDFSLHFLGEFEDSDGTFSNNEKFVIDARQFEFTKGE